MSQHDYNIANQGFPGARTDLNNALSAIATNNSGATAPASTFAHQWWYDSTANILKMRNAANNAWINIGTFNQGANSWRLVGSALSGIDANPAPDTTLTRTLGTSSLVWDNVFTRQINSGPLAGFRNAIINGNFDVWQRGTSFSNPANGAYLADRWSISQNGSGATRTISREAFTVGQTDVPGEPQYFLRYDQSVAGTGATFNLLFQPVEGVRTFAGQQVTLSFYAKGGAAFNIAARITQSFGTGGSPSANTSTTIISSTAVTTSWALYTGTITVPSISGKTLGTNENGFLGVAIDVPQNATFTLDLSRVQLELGPVATPFERRPIHLEEVLCHRYYRRWTGEAATGYATGQCFSTTSYSVQMELNPSMRATPTLTSSNVAIWNATGTGQATTDLAVNATSRRSHVRLNGTVASGLVAGDVAYLHASGGGFIDLSAEL